MAAASDPNLIAFIQWWVRQVSHPTQVNDSGRPLVANPGQSVVRNSSAPDDDTIFTVVAEIQHAVFLSPEPPAQSNTYNLTARNPQDATIAGAADFLSALRALVEICQRLYIVPDTNLQLLCDHLQRQLGIRFEVPRADVRTGLEESIRATAPAGTPEVDIRDAVNEQMEKGFLYVHDLRGASIPNAGPNFNAIEWANSFPMILWSLLATGSIAAFQFGVAFTQGVRSMTNKAKCMRPRLVLKAIYLLKDPVPLVRTNTSVRRIAFSPPKRRQDDAKDTQDSQSPAKRANSTTEAAA